MNPGQSQGHKGFMPIYLQCQIPSLYRHIAPPSHRSLSITLQKDYRYSVIDHVLRCTMRRSENASKSWKKCQTGWLT